MTRGRKAGGQFPSHAPGRFLGAAATRTGAAALAAVAILVLVGSAASSTGSRHTASAGGQSARHALLLAARPYSFPLKLSANRRYLVDQHNTPFLITGDSPQAMIGNLGVQDAAMYIANRRAAGFNALLVDLLCAKYTGCRDDGKTIDGIPPFTKPGDLSTPNARYFARAAAMIGLAEKAGIEVFLDPIETGGWLGVLHANGIAKDRAYGAYVAKTFARFHNIVWTSGNDFQTWSNASDDAVVLAVAQGIRSVDPRALQTVELNYPNSSSRDDARWQGLLSLDAAYTYWPTYAEVLREYNRKPPLPVFMAEAGYEFEQNTADFSSGDPWVLRRQEYWSILAGAAGQFYGNHYTWQFTDGWKSHLDTPGSVQNGYLVKLFGARPWFRLVPDQAHAIVTSGTGSFSTTGNVGSSDYVTTASTPDGRLAISYVPAGGTVAVDAARFAGRVSAQWYDPTNGTYTPAAESPFPNSGSVSLTTPGKNADGDADWVLVLSAQ